MKKNLFVFIVISCLILSASSVNAQGSDAWKRYRHDFGVGYGFNTVLAKIGERDNLSLNFMLQRSSLSASYRFYFLRKFSARASFTQLSCRKNDKDINRDTRQNLRVDYQTSMTEMSLFGEFHFFDESGKNKRGKNTRARGGFTRVANIGLSVYAGVSANYFRPKAEYFGKQVFLRPVNDNPGINTNVDSYKKMNLLIPVGVNARYVMSENLRIGVDLGYRFGFRDYINDASAVYYDDKIEESELPWSEFPDARFAGYVHFDDSNLSVKDLQLQNGRKGYFVGLITLSYRLKTK